MRSRSVRSTIGLAALGIALVTTSAVDANGDGTTLIMRVADPPPVAYESTALGRATHPVHLVMTNAGPQRVQLAPLLFRFRATRDNVAFSCEDASGEDTRWPATLDAGASFSLARDVSCETPVPGRYEVVVRGRPRGGPDSAERDYAVFSLQIEPGANPPVHVPWAPSLEAASSATKEVRPTKDPNSARVVIALINASPSSVTLAPLHATLRVTRRGSTVAPCPERGVELAFDGSLAAGSSRAVTTPLGCALSAEAIYDVDVAITNAAGAKVHVATHAIRAGLIPPPPPRPEDARPSTGKVIGGM